MCVSGNYTNIKYLEGILSLVVRFNATVRRPKSPGQCWTEIFSACTPKASQSERLNLGEIQSSVWKIQDRIWHLN